MFAPLLRVLFGSKNDREVKRMRRAVRAINALEEQMVALTDEQLRAKTEEFRGRLGKGETLDQLLPEAFAVAREAGKRVMGMRHFDVQLIGGMVLHEGKIARCVPARARLWWRPWPSISMPWLARVCTW